MPTHVAFLRGINVGGHTVTNARLAEVVAGLGLDDVSTFQASGNVLFSGEGTDDELAERIGAGLMAALGWPAPAFVRGAAEVHAIADADVFPDAPDGARVQVAFLRAPLSPDEVVTVRDHAVATDRVHVDGTELWWLLGTGRTMESGIGDPALARFLGDRWTVRTHATVQRIARRLA